MTPEQGRELLGLLESGRATPQAVVDAAQPEDSVLHDLLEWDDAVAGPKWRLAQARRLIVTVVVQHESTVRELRPAYVKNPSAPANTPGYVRTISLATEADRALDALEAEIRRVESLVDRARNVAANLGLSIKCEQRLRSVIATPLTVVGDLDEEGPRASTG